MNVKTYRASTTKAALEQIKRELGVDAFILGQREVRPGKLLSVFRKSYVEVTAAVDYSDSKRAKPEPGLTEVDRVSDRVELCSAPVNPPTEPAPITADRAAEPVSGHQILLDEIHKLKSMVQSIPSNRAQNTVWLKPRRFSNPGGKQAYLDLVGQGIEESLAGELIASGASPSATEDELKTGIASALGHRIHVYPDLVRPGNHQKPEVVALLGPTGVGKTTTLAKIAALAALQERLKVGLVTLDTFRIAAIEQLKTYSEIMGVPVRVAASVKEMKSAIQSFAGRDLVLIDTAGQSQHELSGQWELAEFMSESTDIKKALVVSATTKQSDLRNIVDRYQIFGIDCLIFTKLDETEIHGPLINELVRSGKPMAYVTTGQRVPQDILRPNATRIIEFALDPNPSRKWERFSGVARAARSRPENGRAAVIARQ